MNGKSLTPMHKIGGKEEFNAESNFSSEGICTDVNLGNERNFLMSEGSNHITDNLNHS